jgi:ABC-2 type transport system permease protein
MVFYPTIHNQTAQLDKSFNSIPASARALFTDTPDLFSPVGYLSSQLFYLMLPLLLTVLAIGLGSSLIAKEEDSRTIELLLSRPVSRQKLLAQKALAGASILAVVGLVSFVCTWAACELASLDVGAGAVGVATLYSVALAAVFGAIALLVASLGRWGRLASIGVAAMVGLVSYLVSSLVSVVGWLKWPAKFLPNHYYHPGEILHGSYEWWPLLGFGVVIAVCVGVAVLAFFKRDVG